MEQMNTQSAGQLLGASAVAKRTSLSRFSIYRMAKAGQFPAPLQIGPRRVAWREADIVEWAATRQPVGWAAAA